MVDRKLLLIIICILIIAVAVLSLFFLKDVFTAGNSAFQYQNDPGGQENRQGESSSVLENSSNTQKPEENNEIEASGGNNQTTNNDVENDPTGETENSPVTPTMNPAQNEINNAINEGDTNAPSPSPEPNNEDTDNQGSDDNTNVISTTPSPAPSKNMLNVLFLGIDRTEARDETRMASAADTIMLARIDIDNKTMKVLSIPRDTYAYIPVTDKIDKINSSYSYGSLQGKGVKSTKDAVLHLMDKACTIDYYFSLDMEPVPDIIDDLGGVEIDVERNMQSHGVSLSKGLQVLDGKLAYDYIRWRYADDGDIGRIRRQQQFIKAMFNKLKASDMERDILRIVLSYDSYINTDLGLEQLNNIIKLFSGISEESIQFYTLPGEGKTIDNISYWIMNEDKTKEVLDEFIAN